MDTLIPIICVAGAIALFVLAFFLYKKPSKTNLALPTTSSQNKINTTFWNRFFNFDEFVTTQILKAIYIIGTAVIISALFGGGIIYTISASIEARPVSEKVQGFFVALIITIWVGSNNSGKCPTDFSL